MKKTVLMVLLGAMVLGVAACSSGKVSTGSEITGTLEELMGKIYKDTKLEFPETNITEVTSENVEYFLGTSDVKYEQAIASEPVMSSQAHSVVLLRVPEGSHIEDIKTKIKDNVDGRKWICVGVEEENIIVDHIGNLVILIMDENSKVIQESFLNLKEQ